MEKITINVGGRKKIVLEEIIMLQADINYTNIHLVDGTSILVAYTLKKLEGRFSDYSYFIRPNKSILLNLQYVTSFDGIYLQIAFPKGNFLKNTPVSRRKMNFVIEKMNELNNNEIFLTH